LFSLTGVLRNLRPDDYPEYLSQGCLLNGVEGNSVEGWAIAPVGAMGIRDALGDI